MKHGLLLHLTVRSESKSEFSTQLVELAREWCQRLEGESISAIVMAAHENDPFRMAGDASPARAFDASIEVELEASDAHGQFEDLVRGFGSRFEAWIDPALSVAQVGSKKVFRSCAPTPVRYQYCMKKRDDLTTEAYLRHYAEVHSKFGLMMEGIQGYTQIHLEPEASARLMDLSGLAFRHFGSVSVLHLASVSDFLEGARANSASGFAEDEEKFVDRPQSLMWVSDEVFRTTV